MKILCDSCVFPLFFASDVIKSFDRVKGVIGWKGLGEVMSSKRNMKEEKTVGRPAQNACGQCRRCTELTGTAVAAVGAASAVGAALFYHFENNTISTTELAVHSDRIPEGFDGCRIVQVSDLHNKMFGKHQKKLMKKLIGLKPDLICLTGDLIYKRKPDIEAALELVEQASQLAPVYFVTGNHEQWSGAFEQLEEPLRRAGAVILDNDSITLFRGGDAVSLIGLKDIDFISYDGEEDGGVTPGQRKDRLDSGLPRYSAAQKDAFERRLSELCRKAQLEWPAAAPDSAAAVERPYQIVLSHKPEFAEIYARQGVDLVLCGHAHGGQVRLPLIGGLYAPGQGALPKYTSGLYDLGSTSMVVSRGLGDSVIPMRVFNRPELVTITLRSKEKE